MYVSLWREWMEIASIFLIFAMKKTFFENVAFNINIPLLSFYMMRWDSSLQHKIPYNSSL